MWVGRNLITSLGLGLDLGLDIEKGVEMDAASVVNIFSSCYLGIFPKPSTFLCQVPFLNSPVAKLDKIYISY